MKINKCSIKFNPTCDFLIQIFYIYLCTSDESGDGPVTALSQRRPTPCQLDRGLIDRQLGRTLQPRPGGVVNALAAAVQLNARCRQRIALLSLS